jgi:hypothetical protein
MTMFAGGGLACEPVGIGMDCCACAKAAAQASMMTAEPRVTLIDILLEIMVLIVSSFDTRL